MTAPRIAASVALIGLLAACSLAPEYHRPDVAVTDRYKEAGDWLPAAPDVANTARGPWWKAYGDADLDALEDKVTAANQDLKAALARYDEARAAAGVARAGYFPTVSATAGAARGRTSRTTETVAPVAESNNYIAGLDLTYEIDLWGRVRNQVAAGESRAQASAADLAAMDLSLHAELAMDYFTLRGADAAQDVVDQAVVSYEKALALTKYRHDGGVSSEADVDQAETQLENAKTLAAETHLTRAQLEHAVAVLVGENPSGFTLPAGTTQASAPPPVPGIPSKLLEQRPDIAASALRVEAANADIGVARAAYLPDFSFDAMGGFESATASRLFNAPSFIWSVGPSAALTLFDGGRISALSDEARAAYGEAVANYRQTVLSAFQQVEDQLIALRQLAAENETQTAAVNAAERSLAQANNRYHGGVATYLDVVVAQNTALQAERDAITLRTRRLNANVLLVKALGGGWHTPAVQDAAPQNTVPTPEAPAAPEASPDRS